MGRIKLTMHAAIVLLSACAGAGSVSPLVEPDEFLSDVALATVTQAEPSTDALSQDTVRETEFVAGTGEFVAMPDDVHGFDAPPHRSGTSAELNLVGVSIEEAANTVLGQRLGLPFVVRDNVSGQLTLQTNGPVPEDVLLPALENALGTQGLALIETGEIYEISLAADARQGASIALNRPSASTLPGYRIVVEPLDFISASEMADLLAPIVPPEGILRIDDRRNLLILAGTSRELRAMLEAIEVFDVDWLEGMSFAIVPVRSTLPSQVSTEVMQVLGTGDAMLGGLVRLVPNDRLGAVIVVSPRLDAAQQVEAWIRRFDEPSGEAGQEMFVYDVQNGVAEELAEALQAVLSGSGLSPGLTTNVAPGLVAQTTQRDEAGNVQTYAASRAQVVTGSGLAGLGSVRIYPYDGKNALLIIATPRDYERVLRMLESLDVVSNQVLIEATIVEVSLRDELSRGVRWFFTSGDSQFTFTDAANGSLGAAFPGFSFVFDDGDTRAVLNALSSITDVNVLSSPSIMVLDNKTATLQVGDEVPVATQSAVAVIDPTAPIVNTVSFRDTGVILSITPRVNDSGLVLLEIEQEVSDVVDTTTSGIDSPTIQQRRISTTVAVNDGESLALGGLIEDSVSRNQSGIPILSEIPFLGEAFRSTTDTTERTELLVIITPRVIRSMDDARRVTDEFRRRMTRIEPFEARLEPEDATD